MALARHRVGTTFVAESALAGIDLPDGVRVWGLTPAVTRRATATALVEAATIPAVESALRVLASLRPSPADVEVILDARRRSASHRARFSSSRTTYPARTAPPEESPMPFPSPARLAQAGAVVAAGALLLTACSGDPAPSASTSPPE